MPNNSNTILRKAPPANPGISAYSADPDLGRRLPRRRACTAVFMSPGLVRPDRLGSRREEKTGNLAENVAMEGSMPLEISKEARKVKMLSTDHDAIFRKWPGGM